MTVLRGEHINIYSKSESKLGRMLSNFYHSPFVLEKDGFFNSVEGYWFWLGTRDERLRKLSGFKAKKLGGKLPRKFNLEESEFKLKIEKSISL